MKPSRLFRKYRDKIVGSNLGESDIIGLKSHLNGSRCNSSLSDAELSDLFAMVQEFKPIIVPEQSEKGLNWLLNQWKTPTGKERKNNPFNSYHETILENFGGFLLVGFIDESTTQYRRDYRPIYRVLSNAGQGNFDYFAYPWQSNKCLEIL